MKDDQMTEQPATRIYQMTHWMKEDATVGDSMHGPCTAWMWLAKELLWHFSTAKHRVHTHIRERKFADGLKRALFSGDADYEDKGSGWTVSRSQGVK